jgi:hypothetical protein
VSEAAADSELAVPVGVELANVLVQLGGLWKIRARKGLAILSTKNWRKRTNFNKFQQISTNFNKFQQISTNFNKFQQISTNFNKFQQEKWM